MTSGNDTLLEKNLDAWHKVITDQAQKEKKCIFVMTHNQIAEMRTKGKKPTYARMVVDFCPQKEDPNRTRITAGGNLIKYAGELTTRTADLTTAKMLRNSVISTDGEIFMGLDIGNFYLETTYGGI